MYYVTCAIWGVAQGSFSTNALAALHDFSNERLFVLLLGVFICAEGVGDLALAPIVSKYIDQILSQFGPVSNPVIIPCLS